MELQQIFNVLVLLPNSIINQIHDHCYDKMITGEDIDGNYSQFRNVCASIICDRMQYDDYDTN